jgi:tRNA (guanine-N7-)-methyltransferase
MSSNATLANAKRISSFGRRLGRALSPRKKQLLDELLPTLKASSNLAEQYNTLKLEVGSGAGEFIAARAKLEPSVGFISCEPFINGVVSLLGKIAKENITNIHLYPDDARDFLISLPDASLDTVYILFPDPWPKPRHHKRRLVNQETLSSIARVLKPSGLLHMTTDHVDYGSWMLQHALHHLAFDWQAKCKTDWREPPAGWIPTRYETKTRAEGREPMHLLFSRI